VRIPHPCESYDAFYYENLIGFLSHSVGTSFLTTQICYYIDVRMTGNSIASEELETLVQRLSTLKALNLLNCL
jgi:hypothetical protein